MKRLTRNYINGVADRVTKAYMNLPEIKGKEIFCIDPELLLTKVLGLKIEYAHLSLDGSILGLTSFGEVDIEIYDDANSEIFLCLDGKTVAVEEQLHNDISKKGRCNFTIMHEAAHQVFKMLFPREYSSEIITPALHFYTANAERKKPIHNWEEWQANTLAAFLLMPEDLIKKGMYLFGLGNKIQCLNKVYRPVVYDRFVSLAKLLGSSKQALAIRMQQLDLLEENHLDNPYKIIEVEWEDQNERRNQNS